MTSTRQTIFGCSAGPAGAVTALALALALALGCSDDQPVVPADDSGVTDTADAAEPADTTQEPDAEPGTDTAEDMAPAEDPPLTEDTTPTPDAPADADLADSDPAQDTLDDTDPDTLEDAASDAVGDAGDAGGDLSDAGDDTSDTGPEPCEAPDGEEPADPVAAGIPTEGLVLWLQAERGLHLDGARVCRWEDQSGQGHDLLQDDEGMRPTQQSDTAWGPGSAIAFDINGEEALERRDTLGIAATSGRTFFVVARLDDFAVRNQLFTQLDAADPELHLAIEPNPWQTDGNRFGIHVTRDAFDGPMAVDQSARMHALVAQSLEPGEAILDHVSYRVDGINHSLTRNTPAPSGGDGTVADFSAADLTRIRAHGEIGEVLVYDRGLSPGELGDVESYLAGRWGILVGP